MRNAWVLAAALMLPACASEQKGGKGDEEWYAHSPTGEKNYDREGGYAALGGLLSMEQFDIPGNYLKTDDSDIGFSLRGGWRTATNFAVEAAMELAPGYSVDVAPPYSPEVTTSLDLWSFLVSGKAYFTRERVQPYVLAGLGWARAETKYAGLDESGPFVRFGAGVDIYLDKDIAVFGELNYNWMGGDIDELTHSDIVAGLLFRF